MTGVEASGSLLTVDEAAGYLNVPVRFVRRLIAERRIAVVHLGRHVRLELGDLDALVSAGRAEAVDPAGQITARSR